MSFYDSKLILITGASSGIGRALAIELAKLNARLILTGRKENALLETCNECLQYTNECTYYVGDTGSWDHVKNMGDEIKKNIGIPDILINNAGEGAFKSITECQTNEAELALKAPYLSAFFCVQVFIKEFKQRNAGIIINLNTPAAYFPFPETIAYSSTRAAVRHFSRCLRMELRGLNIKVQEVVPGLTQSAYFENNNMEWNQRIPQINQLLFKPLSPLKVAKCIVENMPGNKKLICPQPLMKFMLIMSNYLPGLFDYLVTLRLKKN